MNSACNRHSPNMELGPETSWISLCPTLKDVRTSHKQMVRWNTHSKETRLPVAGSRREVLEDLAEWTKALKNVLCLGQMHQAWWRWNICWEYYWKSETSLPNYTIPFPRSIWVPGITEHKGHATQNKRSTEQHSNTPFFYQDFTRQVNASSSSMTPPSLLSASLCRKMGSSGGTQEFCICYWKKSMYRWTCAVQDCIVEGPIMLSFLFLLFKKFCSWFYKDKSQR